MRVVLIQGRWKSEIADHSGGMGNKIVPMRALAFDSGADWTSRAIAIGALIYLISPIDAVPDVLPGGLLDDLAVILAAAAQIVDVLRKYVND